MAEPKDIAPSRSAALSQALRRLRRLRGLAPGAMADAMGMQRRTYEYFEAGRGKINVDRIHQFAKVLDVDPYAILAAVEIRAPGFAVACAEHKMMTVFMVGLQEFDANANAAVAKLNTATIVTGFTHVFEALAREATGGEDYLDSWTSEAEPYAQPHAEPNEDSEDPDDDPKDP